MRSFEVFTCAPRAELAPFVDNIWGVRGHAREANRRRRFREVRNIQYGTTFVA